MIWNLLKLKPQSKDNSKRSEEVSDIIDRMPTTFGKWVARAVVLFTLLLFVFGWTIKYPDVVTGQININSTISPIKLPAHVYGKIEILGFNARDFVKEGEYIAIIQNPADTRDMQKIAALIGEFDPNDFNSLESTEFPEKVSLGELNIKYYTFLSALKSIIAYYKKNVHDQQRLYLLDAIKWKNEILKETEKVLRISDDNLHISEKWFNKYSSLNKEVVTTHELEIDKSNMEYLSAKQHNQELIKEMASIRLQIAENENGLLRLEVEKNEKERQMQLELLSSYYELHDQIKQWEQTYVLKSPFDGQVEFLKFWTSGQFVQAGEEVFGIIPKENTILGQVFLPALGAGKVKEGSEVLIKLDDYPYAEFGSVKGVVKSISLITKEYQTAQTSINTYLVLVDIPDGLVTNYGDVLDFKYEIGGVADIIVNDRRLIERLFDNLKSRTQ